MVENAITLLMSGFEHDHKLGCLHRVLVRWHVSQMSMQERHYSELDSLMHESVMSIQPNRSKRTTKGTEESSFEESQWAGRGFHAPKWVLLTC
jgi:hypothetical protein